MHSELLLKYWAKSSSLPLGKKLFSFFIGKKIPYTGSIPFTVQALSRGSACVSLDNKRCVQNHFSSMHAIALANIGELTTGLALHSALPKGYRAILCELSVEYVKKAKKTVLAQSVLPNIDFSFDFMNISIDCKIIDKSSHDLLTNVKAVWKVSV